MSETTALLSQALDRLSDAFAADLDCPTCGDKINGHSQEQIARCAEPLVCALCGLSESRFEEFPQLAGRGWKPGVAFHPDCAENLRKYGAR